MAEILGLGLSHFGGFMFPDEDMASRVRACLDEGSLPANVDHPSKWPDPIHALGQKQSYCELLESHLMNSSKCIAVFPPR